ncbi:MAG TPA: secondary thiamine-phosphate synthase enzyme YjbQ [Candidatus Paceibacterota bacterium]|nr:secondary thiamine-phosphate synthase enzyme YjbQ [Candidatus Paceibacterota bacterium]
MLRQLDIETSKEQEIINITDKIRKIILESGIKNGICVIHSLHTTAGIIINEISDKNLCDDILKKFDDIVPEKEFYKHNLYDNNANAHIKSSIIGLSKSIIIKDSNLLLGTWQEIGLIELDGPRQRKIFIKIIGE